MISISVTGMEWLIIDNVPLTPEQQHAFEEMVAAHNTIHDLVFTKTEKGYAVAGKGGTYVVEVSPPDPENEKHDHIDCFMKAWIETEKGTIPIHEWACERKIPDDWDIIFMEAMFLDHEMVARGSSLIALLNAHISTKPFPDGFLSRKPNPNWKPQYELGENTDWDEIPF